MANFDANKNVRGTPVLNATRTTLTTADTFTYTPNANQILELHNNTAGVVTVTIKGTTPSAAFAVPGTGITVDLSAGLVVSLPVSASKLVHLDAISAYLAGSGQISVASSAAGVTAVLLSN